MQVVFQRSIQSLPERERERVGGVWTLVWWGAWTFQGFTRHRCYGGELWEVGFQTGPLSVYTVCVCVFGAVFISK